MCSFWGMATGGDPWSRHVREAKTRNGAQFAWRVSRARGVEDGRRRAGVRVWVGADACAAERDASRVETFRGGNDADARLVVTQGARPVEVSCGRARFCGAGALQTISFFSRIPSIMTCFDD